MGEAKRGDSVINFYHHTDKTPFFSAIRECTTGNTIIVFPDDFSLEAYIGSCPIDLENTLVIPDKLTETKKHKAFCSVYNGEKNIII